MGASGSHTARVLDVSGLWQQVTLAPSDRSGSRHVPSLWFRAETSVDSWTAPSAAVAVSAGLRVRPVADRRLQWRRRRLKDHDAAQQGVESDEALHDWSFAA